MKINPTNSNMNSTTIDNAILGKRTVQYPPPLHTLSVSKINADSPSTFRNDNFPFNIRPI
ncbi:hypothetical protein DSCOOX_44340 [Desulfosarcina ovata subsp. ovata]|uniref:Uncharacterized protein n=1 Tax=Desulfosarcina ovata subsp. ovata TaxID=2752305 RepID=A0A5K8AHC5_9BACT|nr:hypothetical protein DSCOOX_44340 [Desulfosarcina ovata subsp. ovata]